MINDSPIIEFVLFKHDEYSYKAFITGLNGRVDWDVFDELRSSMIEEPPTSHPEIKPIIALYDHERDGAITISAELSLIELERQYGTGEGEVFLLPAYYDILNCKVVEFQPLTVRN